MQCEVLDLLQVERAPACRLEGRARWMGASIVILCDPCADGIAEWWGEIPVAESTLAEAQSGDLLPDGHRIEYVVQGDKPGWAKVYYRETCAVPVGQAPGSRGNGLFHRQLPVSTPVMRPRKAA